jgi:hypothetical protein
MFCESVEEFRLIKRLENNSVWQNAERGLMNNLTSNLWNRAKATRALKITAAFLATPLLAQCQ